MVTGHAFFALFFLKAATIQAVPVGLEIIQDDAFVAMGKSKDVVLSRSGPKQLNINSAVKVDGTVDVKALKINGKPFSGQCKCSGGGGSVLAPIKESCGSDCKACSKAKIWADASVLTTQNAKVPIKAKRRQLKAAASIQSCASLLRANPKLKNGVYTIVVAGKKKKKVYCDMTNGGWMLFGVYGNVAPKMKPHDYFPKMANGGIRTGVESYKSKKTWSASLFDYIPKGRAMEMVNNIQTAKFANGAAAKTASSLYTNGIIYIPDSAMLGMDDPTLEKMEPLAIRHKCTLKGDYKRRFTMVDRDKSKNSYMQFSDGLLGSKDHYAHDIWHWNAGLNFYYRPGYTFCDNDQGSPKNQPNPGNAVQAIFWVRPVLIPGCTDIKFKEFNPKATVDNGSCKTKLPANALTSCAARRLADPTAKDGVYPMKLPGGMQKVYCDMKNGGWMLFGAYGNVAPKMKPHDYFSKSVNGGPRTSVEPYDFKKTWSASLFDYIPKGRAMEMVNNIQTAKFANGAAAKTASSLYTNGIIYIPDSAMLGMDDPTLEKMEPLAIQHKCTLKGDYKRRFTMVDRDKNKNSYMQFSDGLLGSKDHYSHDIWHWNAGLNFYYRPGYTFCDNDQGSPKNQPNPGNAVQAIFWIRPSLIPGCTKFGFLEYNPAANFDDGTCYTKIKSETCEERHWAYSSLPDGIYNQHPKKGGLEKKSYCDMTNGGWMLFGVMANKPTVSPDAFFKGVGGLKTKIEPYAKKKTWSGNIFDFAPKGTAVEVAINIQTSNYANEDARTRSKLYTNGIIMVPDSELLTLTDPQIEAWIKKKGGLKIKHKCNMDDGYYRTLTKLDKDKAKNSKMQFTDGKLGGLDNFVHDLWHWNSGNNYYFRPQYGFCDNDAGSPKNTPNPGNAVQAVFWIRPLRDRKFRKIFEGNCIGGKEIKMYNDDADNPGKDFASWTKECGRACSRRQKSIGGHKWPGFNLHGFIVNPKTGQCWCEGEPSDKCPKNKNSGFIRFDYISASTIFSWGLETPYTMPLVQANPSQKPTLCIGASPTGLNALRFEGSASFDDVVLKPNGGSLHWFFALKAKATNKYHNVFDALGHQSMCLWVDKNNQYEFNNCAGAKYDTLRSKATAGKWQVVQASVVKGKTNVLWVNNEKSTGTYGDSGKGFAAATSYSIFNRNGNEGFVGDIGEVIVVDSDLTNGEQAEIRAYLKNKWLKNAGRRLAKLDFDTLLTKYNMLEQRLERMEALLMNQGIL